MLGARPRHGCRGHLYIAELKVACYSKLMSLTSIRLPDHLVRELDEVAGRRHTTRSDLVREAVEQYCAALRSGGELDPVALVDSLVTYEGSGRGDLGRRSEHYLREIFRERRRRRAG